MPYSPIKVIALDLIGTLVCRPDQEFSEFCADLLTSKGYPLTAIEIHTLYRRGYIEYSFGNYTDDLEFLTFAFTFMDRQEVARIKDLLIAKLIDLCRPFDDSDSFLAAVAATGLTVVIASNFVESWAETLIRQQRWSDFFSRVFVSSTLHVRKPSSKFFGKMTNALAVPPTNILMIGDSHRNDVYGGLHAGLQVIHLDRARSKGYPVEVANVRTVASLTELLPLLVG